MIKVNFKWYLKFIIYNKFTFMLVFCCITISRSCFLNCCWKCLNTISKKKKKKKGRMEVKKNRSNKRRKKNVIDEKKKNCLPIVSEFFFFFLCTQNEKCRVYVSWVIEWFQHQAVWRSTMVWCCQDWKL